mmetsp:Transcript_25648/g.38338  ORF Transcript_25648/g.38338 Transcript_25648/m.38338 type:complete len:242 (-) Transcript_25648:337-1062(-)
MSNVHGLHSNRDNDSDESDNEERYVGGTDGRGGGSGLAVQPNPEDLFSRAEHDASAKVKTKITMYKGGFVVDDGPYRRLDDPANADFLRALASGRIPAELVGDSGPGGVDVGLVDRRTEDYVEPFSSFSGSGNALGAIPTSDRGIIDVTSDYFNSPPEIPDDNTVSIQVRLLNGKRIVVKLSRNNNVSDLVRAIHANPVAQDAIGEPYVLSAGFPPKRLEHLEDSIADSNLAGAVVVQKKP